MTRYIEQLQATITVVERPLGTWAFSAIAQSRHGVFRILLPRPPSTPINVGDELLFKPAQANSGRADGIREVAPHPDAAAAAMAALLSSDGTVYRSAGSARDATGAPHFGVADAMIWAKKHGIAKQLQSSPGVTILSRPDAEKAGDPIIQWVTSRFADESIRDIRNPADIVISPEAIGAASQEFKRGIFASSPCLQIAASLLPDYLLAGEQTYQHALKTWSGVPSAVMPNIFPIDRSVGLMFPYSLRESSMMFAAGVSGWNFNGAVPRHLVSARSRFLFSAVHEMSHLLRVDIEGSASAGSERTPVAVVQRSEAFADSVSLMLFVAETGNVEDARRVANLRSIAALANAPLTHLTGRACNAAIAKGIEFRAKLHGAPRMARVVEESLRIALKNQIAPEDDYLRVRAELDARKSDWRTLPTATIAVMVSEVLESIGVELWDVDTVSQDMTASLNALSATFIQKSEMSRDDARARVASIAKIDFENHIGESIAIAGRSATREAFGGIIDLLGETRDVLASFRPTDRQLEPKSWLGPTHIGTRSPSISSRNEDMLDREAMLVSATYAEAIEARQRFGYRLAPLGIDQTRPMFLATRRCGGGLDLA